VKDDITASEAASEVGVAIVNGAPAGGEPANGTSEIKESETANSTSEAKQGCLHDSYFLLSKISLLSTNSLVL
jgi:protein TIF31